MRTFSIPPETPLSPEYHNQTEQKKVSDDEFNALFEPPKLSTFDWILRILLQIIFISPIKLVVTLFAFVFYSTLSSLFPLFRSFFSSEKEFKKWSTGKLKCAVYFFVWGAGVLKVNFKGKKHPGARAYCFNHLSPVDITVMMSQFDLSYIGMDSLKKNFLIRRAADNSDFFFVDRTKSGGFSNMLKSAMENDQVLPLLVSPEGKISNGNAILAFRTGAFLTDKLVQPVCLRYHHYLCPRKLGSMSWVQDSFWDFVIQIMTVPFMTVDVTALEPINWEGQNLTPTEKALRTQLAMANYLGIPAIDRTNKEIFQGNSTEEKEKND